MQYFLTFLNIYITLTSLKIRKKRQKKKDKICKQIKINFGAHFVPFAIFLQKKYSVKDQLVSSTFSICLVRTLIEKDVIESGLDGGVVRWTGIVSKNFLLKQGSQENTYARVSFLMKCRSLFSQHFFNVASTLIPHSVNVAKRWHPCQLKLYRNQSIL